MSSSQMTGRGLAKALMELLGSIETFVREVVARAAFERQGEDVRAGVGLWRYV